MNHRATILLTTRPARSDAGWTSIREPGFNPAMAILTMSGRYSALKPNTTKKFHRYFVSLWMTLAGALCVCSANAGPTGALNDTGLGQAYDSGGLFPCSAFNTDDNAAHPRQDCRFGRDAQAAGGQLTKSGGGVAGFDFVALRFDGSEIPTVNGKPAPGNVAACVHDRVTNLIWEIKTDNNSMHDAKWHHTWYDSNPATNAGYPGGTGPDTCGGTVSAGCDTEAFAAAVNAEGLCGAGNPWRLPTRRELLSIVHNGALASSIKVDQDFFGSVVPVPNSWLDRMTNLNWTSGYWSSDSVQIAPDTAWVVDFSGSSAAANFKGGFLWVASGPGLHWSAASTRLVRSGP